MMKDHTINILSRKQQDYTIYAYAHTHLWKRRANIFEANDWLQSWTIKSRIGFPLSGTRTK